MGDKGEGGLKNLKKWVTSYMDGPKTIWTLNPGKPTLIASPSPPFKKIVECNLKIINPIIHNILWTYTTYARHHF